MGEIAHTPGPWTVGRMQRSSNFAKDTYCVHGDGTILCRVKGGVTEDAAIAEANARLIASAPDLLAVAQAALEEIEPLPTTGSDERGVLVRALKIVIAKATGQ